MTRILEKDQRAKRTALFCKWFYGLAGLLIAASGLWTQNSYRLFLSLASLLLIPALNAFYKLTGLVPAWQLEIRLYIFAFLGFSLGGCLEFYQKIPGYDKVIHTLSGVLVTTLALSLYLYLERERPLESLKPATAILFCFFASLAVAVLFEIGEFILAPLLGRDMQQVAATGVTDTMLDLIVCLAGTLLTLPLLLRFFQGKQHDLTDAAAAFYCKNTAQLAGSNCAEPSLVHDNDKSS